MDASGLNELLTRGETRNVEIKGACAFEDDMRPHLARSIGAMANTPGGGTLVIGVENATWKVVGLTSAQIATFDVTNISHYLKARFSPSPRVEVEPVHHPQGTVLLLQIVEFEDVPIVVNKDIGDSKGHVHAREGDVLIRTKSCECRRITSADDMRELLSRAVTRRSESLLAQIRAVVTGAPPAQPAELPEDLLARELPDWATTLGKWEELHPKFAWWEVNLLPIPALSTPLQPNSMLADIEKSIVRWRGWYYPNTGINNSRPSFLQRYVSFSYEVRQHSERWQASYTGAFASAHIDWGDFVDPDPGSNLQPPPQRFIDFVMVVYNLTEFFRFATSMAEALECEALWLRVGFHNIMGRPLGAFDRMRSPWGAGKASMRDVVQAHVFSRADLLSAWQEFALDWAKQILTVFQWPEASREMLARDQTKLIERRW